MVDVPMTYSSLSDLAPRVRREPVRPQWSGGELLHNMAQHRIARELLRILGEAGGAALLRSVRNLTLLNDPKYSVIAQLSNRKLWVTTDLQTNSVSISCPQWHQFTAA